MAKKPSEWTPQEAWEECKKVAAGKQWCRMDAGSATSEILALPFPADPPEVVSEEYLQSIADGEVGSVCKQNAMRMAAELLARREAERKA